MADLGKRFEVITGDSLEVMRAMPAGSVDAIVTSPPYADQRAYAQGEIVDAPLVHDAIVHQRQTTLEEHLAASAGVRSRASTSGGEGQ